MTLKDCVQFLTVEGYLVQMNHLPYFTNKFYKEIVQKDVGLRVIEPNQAEVIEAMVKPKKIAILPGGKKVDAARVDWQELYQKLILDANIPSQVYTRNGAYRANLATKPGRDAFKEAMLEGTPFDELLQRTSKYYETTDQPVKVENFFKNEIWRNTIDDDRDSIAGSQALG